MIVFDREFAPMGKAAFAEAARIVVQQALNFGFFARSSKAAVSYASLETWRHHGLGCLQRELTPTLRVHIWAPELFRFADDPLRPVHDHRFDLVSFVAAGEIVDVAFRVEKLVPAVSLDGYDRTAYTNLWNVRHAKVQTHEPSKDVECVGPVHVVEAERRILSAGDVYGIERGSFHTTRIERPVAVTVVSRSRFRDSPARILGREIAWGGIVKEREEDLYQEVLGRATKALGEEMCKWFRAEGG